MGESVGARITFKGWPADQDPEKPEGIYKAAVAAIEDAIYDGIGPYREGDEVTWEGVANYGASAFTEYERTWDAITALGLPFTLSDSGHYDWAPYRIEYDPETEESREVTEDVHGNVTLTSWEAMQMYEKAKEKLSEQPHPFLRDGELAADAALGKAIRDYFTTISGDDWDAMKRQNEEAQERLRQQQEAAKV